MFCGCGPLDQYNVSFFLFISFVGCIVKINRNSVCVNKECSIKFIRKKYFFPHNLSTQLNQ